MPPKKTQTRKAASQKQKPRKLAGVPRSIVNRLDEQALAYARLLNDPCGAPLCHPTFAGGDGGMVLRAENTFTMGTPAGTTAATFVWVPGAIGNNAGNGSAIVTGNASSAGAGMALAQVANGFQPGYAFLAANAAEVRVVAACIQVFYPGTELDRSGLIGYGNIPGGTLVNGAAINASFVFQTLERYERTPNEHIEIKWRPTAFDQNHTAPTANTGTAELARRGGLGIVLQGGAPAVGLIIRMVAVYEYTPAYASGLTAPSAARNTSNNSLDQVINFLDSTGDWMVRGSKAAFRLGAAAYEAAPYVRSIAYGGKRVAQALLM